MKKILVKLFIAAAMIFIAGAYSATAQGKELDASVFQNAVDLPINFTLNDSKAENEVKCYRIRPTEDVRYYYRTDSLGISGPGMALYDENYDEITLLKPTWEGTKLNVEPNNTYYIALFSTAKQSSYSITVYTETDDCGSTFDTCKTVSLLDDNYDYLDSPWDHDMFSFTTDYWEYYTILFMIKGGSNVDGSRLMFVNLYDAEGNLIITRRPGGIERYFYWNLTLEPYSKYYLEVKYDTRLSHYADDGTRYPYYFVVYTSDHEIPSWADSAAKLKMNEIVDVTLASDETKYFMFTTPDDENLFYHIWPIDQEYQTQITQKIYDSDFNELSKIYYDYLPDERFGQTLKPNTTYYVSLTNLRSSTSFKFGVETIADDITEPVEITPNKVFEYILQSDPDTDTFKFTTGPEEYYYLNMFLNRGRTNLTATLYDDNDNLVDFIPNYGSITYRIGKTFKLKPFKTYYLVVDNHGLTPIRWEAEYELILYSGITKDAAIELMNYCEYGYTYQATPTKSTVLVNRKKVSFDAYNIHGNNYFKLRDLAMQLNGTGKQFEVEWDALNRVITLTSGKPYTPVGGEMTTGTPPKGEVGVSLTTVRINGVTYHLNSYNIGGNNYYKLRDIGFIFDFGVDWDPSTQSVVIDTTKGYTE